ncbi:zinc-dependent metalloprotease [Yeosuana sp. MJ-SS3]|uniref:Zinc-dependent metalloprotease n=1 Tax=Gilvirhabdus luticola TaxID=3079858 RepID=A0ABU3U711_9FLAO|nr:zinc-dependent metalloprotease [Yeosuana sp. MJ-SS3]MDU8886187.1 zinc-dependent metalloprotease [Yeosuana sp. MJ-SS3]
MKKHYPFLIVLLVSSQLFSQGLKGKSLKSYKGFFNFYYEEAQDKIYLEVETLDNEFLYVNSLVTGIGSNDIGFDRGQIGDQRVVKFIRRGDKLLLVQPNQNYRAVTDNELEKKSVEQAFAQSVLFGFEIKSQTAGKFIIDFSPFLLQDAHGILDTLARKNEGNYTLDLSKSAMSLERTKAFPKNVEFETLLTFKGEPKGKNIKSVTPTPSLISVIQHHSFIELPDDNYRKRAFDPRSGSIFISYSDYSTPIQEPIKKKYIIRHRLEKLNPTDSITEAVEPIVYYLDPGTPEPVRSALLEGASWWNEAFEAIGFKNAFQVEMLPEDADPMDCRYNVIQWVHRSTRGWSYGNSVIDPRTGEIIKGHVSLGSLRIRQDFMIAQALLNRPFANNDHNYKPMLDMALARIRQLSAHEVGHTLGFTHNFAASTNNRASVMDYPHPMVKLSDGEIELSDAYDVGIGDWDKTTVAYSYSQFKNTENEKQALNNILIKAQDKGLRFMADRDARAKNGAHAYAHLWDNGTSASKELENVLKIRKTAISNFSEDNIRNGETYSTLEDVFVPLYFFHRYQTEAVCKVIGGLNYNYAIKGEDEVIVETVKPQQQREALSALMKTITSQTLAIPESKLKLFPPRVYGSPRTRESFKGVTGVAFDPLSAVETASDMALSILFNAERMNRVYEQSIFDKEQLTVNEILETVYSETLKKKPEKGYLGEVQQMINFSVLKNIMSMSANDKLLPQVQAIINFEMMKLKVILQVRHIDPIAMLMVKKIDSYLGNPSGFKAVASPKIPDGSPIGNDVCNYILD